MVAIYIEIQYKDTNRIHSWCDIYQTIDVTPWEAALVKILRSIHLQDN